MGEGYRGRTVIQGYRGGTVRRYMYVSVAGCSQIHGMFSAVGWYRGINRVNLGHNNTVNLGHNNKFLITSPFLYKMH